MSILRIKAHVLLAAPFIVDGISAMKDPDPHADKVLRAWSTATGMGAPELNPDKVRLAARAGGAAAVATAAYLVFGKHKRVAASILTASIVPLALVNAPVWLAGDRLERQISGRKLLDYGALAGGLLLASVDLNGKPSRKWKRHFKVEQKKLIEEARDKALREGAKQTLRANSQIRSGK